MSLKFWKKTEDDKSYLIDIDKIVEARVKSNPIGKVYGASSTGGFITTDISKLMGSGSIPIPVIVPSTTTLPPPSPSYIDPLVGLSRRLEIIEMNLNHIAKSLIKIVDMIQQEKYNEQSQVRKVSPGTTSNGWAGSAGLNDGIPATGLPEGSSPV